MENKVAMVAATPDPTTSHKPPTARPENGTLGKGSAPGLDQVDMRLIIEEDTASGSYVYRTLNRLTGEIILQLPRDQLLKLHEEASYVAGNVVRAKA